VIHEFTHDSFYLGEDGPTHQPVEHLMSLRVMPDMYVMRPADARETQLMMEEALALNLPSCICLTRQKLPMLQHQESELARARKGAWTVFQSDDPDLIFFATGSEVSLALKVAEHLVHSGSARPIVVSVPCWELFFGQDAEYIRQVMRPAISRRVSIEAGATLGWERFVGMDGLKIGLDRYGASAPAEDLEKEFGFSPDAVLRKVYHHFSIESR
jgi:transketolase